eukprot:COSAG01_NODE_652_length_14497_cov_38.547968_13_plen_167_part_00
MSITVQIVIGRARARARAAAAARLACCSILGRSAAAAGLVEGAIISAASSYSPDPLRVCEKTSKMLLLLLLQHRRWQCWLLLPFLLVISLSLAHDAHEKQLHNKDVLWSTMQHGNAHESQSGGHGVCSAQTPCLPWPDGARLYVCYVLAERLCAYLYVLHCVLLCM